MMSSSGPFDLAFSVSLQTLVVGSYAMVELVKYGLCCPDNALYGEERGRAPCPQSPQALDGF